MGGLTVDLSGAAALVTGGSRGIGRAIAVALGQCGAKVMVNYVSNEAAANDVVETIIAGGGEARAVKADVSKKSGVDQLFDAVKQYGGDYQHRA